VIPSYRSIDRLIYYENIYNNMGTQVTLSDKATQILKNVRNEVSATANNNKPISYSTAILILDKNSIKSDIDRINDSFIQFRDTLVGINGDEIYCMLDLMRILTLIVSKKKQNKTCFSDHIAEKLVDVIESLKTLEVQSNGD